jgi:L-lactate utilization protein LutC
MTIRIIVILAVSLFVAAACSDGDSNGDGNGTAAPSVCDQADTLQQSVDELTQLDVIAVGLDGLNAAVDQVTVDIESLSVLVGVETADEAAVLAAAIEQADETFSTLEDQESLLAATAEVGLVIAQVAIAADGLKEALSFECA